MVLEGSRWGTRFVGPGGEREGGFGPGLIGLRGRGSEDSDFQAYEKGLGLGILGLKEDVAGRLDALV